MYNVYNENGELVGQNLTEDQLIDLATKNLQKQTIWKTLSKTICFSMIVPTTPN